MKAQRGYVSLAWPQSRLRSHRTTQPVHSRVEGIRQPQSFILTKPLVSFDLLPIKPATRLSLVNGIRHSFGKNLTATVSAIDVVVRGLAQYIVLREQRQTLRLPRLTFLVLVKGLTSFFRDPPHISGSQEPD
jgi:hypothetical protein